MNHGILCPLVPCLLVILHLFPLAAFGGEEETLEEEGRIEVRSRWKEYLRQHFEIRGHLSTAFVSVHNRDEDQPRAAGQVVQGLGEGETFDYRIAALQVRYEPAPRHSFLLQLSHRKFADSPVTAAEGEVDMDWLFYRYTVNEHLEVTLGRFPVANGLFNKFRDVGVILPFFRPSFNLYREGGLFSEIADGVGLRYTHRWDSGWGLEVEGYYGRNDRLEQGSSTATGSTRVVAVEVELDQGLQLWLGRPSRGLKLGLGAQRFKVGAGSGFNDGPATWNTWTASVEYLYRKLTLRGEYRRLDFPVDTFPTVDNTAYQNIPYLQAGYQFTSWLQLWVQAEWAQAHQRGAIFLEGSESFNDRQDLAFSAVFPLKRNLVWKVEFHRERFELATAVVPVFVEGQLRLDVTLEEFKTRYLIASLSVSF